VRRVRARPAWRGRVTGRRSGPDRAGGVDGRAPAPFIGGPRRPRIVRSSVVRLRIVERP
jgi:hypothetical protein